MNTISVNRFLNMLNTYRPSGWLMSIAFILSIIQTGLSLMVPLIARNLIDTLVTDKFNIYTVSILIFVFLSQVVLSGISLYMMIFIGEKIILGLREDLWGRVMKFPLRFYKYC